MTKVTDICQYLETIAPLQLQESYDNAGLICGHKEQEVKGILICLDCTEAVVDEAIENKLNMIVAHHPIVFSGLKKITGSNYIERVIIKAIKNDIAVYAAHTNIDNVLNGVNGKIAEKLGLINTRILSPQKNTLLKLVTFCPNVNAENIRQALFAEGAGAIGKYDECSFNTEGIGTFKANEGTNPYVGEIGKQHHEAETKIECIFPYYLQSSILKALFKAHPYEIVAYDVVPLNNLNQEIGAGIIGELPEAIDEMQFLQELKTTMFAEGIRYTGLLHKKVKTVAVCGGSGSFLLKYAIASGADAFVTADFKYHQFFDAEQKLLIADIGHYESEQFTMELFYDLLIKKFSTFALQLSKINTNPINYL